MSHSRWWVGGVAIAILLISYPASAQESTTSIPATGFGITTPYPSVAVEAGNQATFALAVTDTSPTEVELSISGLPASWDASFRGGGFEVDAIMAGPTSPDLSLDIAVPSDAEEGEYGFEATAAAGDRSASLNLVVRVSGGAGGDVTLTPDFPGLRVPAGQTASFSVELRNDTPGDLQFELNASGPTGWNLTAEPSNEPNAATIQVASGTSTTVNVDATSPPGAEAGQYPIEVSASSPTGDTSAEMVVEIVGSYAVELTTPDQRLNADVAAQSTTDISLVVSNTGTAPITGLELGATAPSGWNVEFVEPLIATLEAGQSMEAVASVTPSDQAIAGDYVITFNATSEQADDEVDIRTTLNPSTLWGLVGVILIVSTLAALAWVFRHFGRR